MAQIEISFKEGYSQRQIDQKLMISWQNMQYFKRKTVDAPKRTTAAM